MNVIDAGPPCLLVHRVSVAHPSVWKLNHHHDTFLPHIWFKLASQLGIMMHAAVEDARGALFWSQHDGLYDWRLSLSGSMYIAYLRDCHFRSPHSIGPVDLPPQPRLCANQIWTPPTTWADCVQCAASWRQANLAPWLRHVVTPPACIYPPHTSLCYVLAPMLHWCFAIGVASSPVHWRRPWWASRTSTGSKLPLNQTMVLCIWRVQLRREQFVLFYSLYCMYIIVLMKPFSNMGWRASKIFCVEYDG